MFGPIDRMAVSSSGVLARRVVLGGSAVLGIVGLYWIGRSFVVDGKLRFGNPVSLSTTPAEGLVPAPSPLSVRAEVTRVTGTQLVKPGATCEFLVEQRQREEGSFYCNTQISCDGKLLYGGPDRGYFPCLFYEGDRRDVVGSDPSTTKEDKDGALRLDTRSGILRVWDDESGIQGAFDIEAEIISAQ